MSEYVPDKWAIIEITDLETNEMTRRVLASWYGGWAGSDSWKISSAIEETKDMGAYYEFRNMSGSVYKCKKHCYGASNYTWGVYDRLERESKAPDSKVFIQYISDFAG